MNIAAVNVYVEQKNTEKFVNIKDIYNLVKKIYFCTITKKSFTSAQHRDNTYHRKSDVGLFESRPIIRTITSDSDDLMMGRAAAVDHTLYKVVLVLRWGTGENTQPRPDLVYKFLLNLFGIFEDCLHKLSGYKTGWKLFRSFNVLLLSSQSNWNHTWKTGANPPTFQLPVHRESRESDGWNPSLRERDRPCHQRGFRTS